jgi:hypothetical protein
MKHARSCPVSTGAVKNNRCTCGAGVPVVAPGGARELSHTSNCARMTEAGHPECTCGAVLPLPEMPPGPAQGASPENDPPPSVHDDSPYADVEYARTLIKRAEALAPENSVLARFLLEIATEARLLAELQGRWEYAS